MNLSIGILLAIFNYLVGSISSAVIITRLVINEDIREIGDRKAGGSNVLKNVGLLWGIIVGAFDVIKGIPILIIAQFMGIDAMWLPFIAISAVIGHNWPIYFNFAGGRGIATIFGTMLFLTPIAALLPLAIFAFSLITALVDSLKKIKIISSPVLTLAALSAYVLMTFICENNTFRVFSIMIMILVLFRRVTARIYEYKKQKSFRLFMSRLLFDNDYSF
ncbi:MAG: glycerol-3-phosphate acyltransferase [Candidatus Dojkabacteria bacterium]|nr:glycerol-3-phosphate acyltransferase [Candidatus Dojkabacteria bacterium]